MNALSPIEVRALPIITYLIELQPLNAEEPIVVTLSGIVMPVIAVLPLNALSLIEVTGKSSWVESITIFLSMQLPIPTTV